MCRVCDIPRVLKTQRQRTGERLVVVHDKHGWLNWFSLSHRTSILTGWLEELLDGLDQLAGLIGLVDKPNPARLHRGLTR